MSTISSLNNSNSTYSLDEFNSKIQKVYEDLNNGKMWLNEDCKTVKKNSKIVRFIKSILSIILPLNLYSGIKADKVALNFFKMVEANKDHLNNSSIKDNVIAIFKKLDESTKKRYTDLYHVLTLATEQLSVNYDKNSLSSDIESSDNESTGSFDFCDKPLSSSLNEIGSVNSNLINQSLAIMSNDDDEAQVALSSDFEDKTSVQSTNKLKKKD